MAWAGSSTKHSHQILHVCVNVVHVFPYSARVPGGHSNAIRGFITCQRAKGINAVAVSPKAERGEVETSWEFPMAEVDCLWTLRWGTIAEHFNIGAGNSLLNLHSVNRRYGALLADLRRTGVPYVLTSHGQLGFQTTWRWLKKFVYLNLFNRDPRKAAGLHLLSGFAARRIRLLLPGYRGPLLAQGNLVTVPNLESIPTAPRGDYQVPPDAFVLIFLGRLDFWVKGLDLLVEAFACLPGDRFRLVLVGPDWQGGRARLEQLATRLGCRNRIHFLGPAYGVKKWALLRMADLFVSPSRWEAFSIAQAEAMAMGLPIVTTTRVNLALELREADAALLVPFKVQPLATAIAAIEADAERRRAVGKRGTAWMRANCDPDRASARFQEFYQSVLQQRATGA
jgi:glycosyltransferase involved in cell wall biosynthesis